MKILVTGASGLLGANIVLQVHKVHEVIAITHAHPVHLHGVETRSVDLTDEGGASIIKEIRPDWVIHCAAGTDVDRCENDHEYAFGLNRDMAGWVAQAANEAGSKLVHISTDAVFDGKNSGKTEDEPPDPKNVYGQSKLEGEMVVSQAHPSALIVRTNFFGFNMQEKTSLAEFFLGKLSGKEGCMGFVDVRVKSILTNHLIAILLQLIEADLSGIYHVLAANCLSKYEFGVALAKEFNLDPNLIDPVEVDRLHLRAFRPHNLCLSTGKLVNALQTKIPSIEDGIRVFRENLLDGYADRLQAMAGGHTG